MFRHAVKKSKKIITPSKTVKDEIVNYYHVNPGKIDVIYEGIDFEFEKKMGDKGEHETLSNYNLRSGNFFFYVGNAYPHKNLEFVIKTIVSFNESEGTNIIFAIAGSKDEFVSRLEKIVKRENAQRFVKILGYVPDEELVFLYKNSIAFIYPSLSEGLGYKVLKQLKVIWTTRSTC